jgi:hypothetical protein
MQWPGQLGRRQGRGGVDAYAQPAETPSAVELEQHCLGILKPF